MAACVNQQDVARLTGGVIRERQRAGSAGGTLEVIRHTEVEAEIIIRRDRAALTHRECLRNVSLCGVGVERLYVGADHEAEVAARVADVGRAGAAACHSEGQRD